MPLDKPIPAHLLGNMWAQSWGNIYDIVAPKDADPGYDVTKLLEQHNYDEIKMVKGAEGFFTSLGFAPLPDSFYQRSLFTKPRDRDVEQAFMFLQLAGLLHVDNVLQPPRLFGLANRQ